LQQNSHVHIKPHAQRDNGPDRASALSDEGKDTQVVELNLSKQVASNGEEEGVGIIILW
jgi:hypothetical protein